MVYDLQIKIRVIKTIDKIDGAKTQIDTAIELFFAEGDLASIHTLTGAAHRILSDVAQDKNIRSLISDIKDKFPKKIQREFIDKIRVPQDFLKHADKDPHEILTLKHDQTALMLFEACILFESITKKHEPIHRTYMLWSFWKFPALLTADGYDEIANQLTKIKQLNKRDIYEVILELKSK